MAWQVYDAFPAPDYYSRFHEGYAGIGPIPCKRWVKHPDDPPHKMNYKWRPPTPERNKEAVHKYSEQLAIKYVEWLAEQGRVKLPKRGIRKVLWKGFESKYQIAIHGHRRDKYPEWLDRIVAVAWGHENDIYNTRKNGRQGAFLYREWIEDSRIEIPHWDFEHPPIEQCEVKAEAA